MTKEEANNKAKIIYEEWQKKRYEVEKSAKESGVWQYSGLDTNEHLFKEIDAEAKREIETLKSKITEP